MKTRTDRTDRPNNWRRAPSLLHRKQQNRFSACIQTFQCKISNIDLESSLDATSEKQSRDENSSFLFNVGLSILVPKARLSKCLSVVLSSSLSARLTHFLVKKIVSCLSVCFIKCLFVCLLVRRSAPSESLSFGLRAVFAYICPYYVSVSEPSYCITQVSLKLRAEAALLFMQSPERAHLRFDPFSNRFSTTLSQAFQFSIRLVLTHFAVFHLFRCILASLLVVLFVLRLFRESVSHANL